MTLKSLRQLCDAVGTAGYAYDIARNTKESFYDEGEALKETIDDLLELLLEPRGIAAEAFCASVRTQAANILRALEEEASSYKLRRILPSDEPGTEVFMVCEGNPAKVRTQSKIFRGENNAPFVLFDGYAISAGKVYVLVRE